MLTFDANRCKVQLKLALNRLNLIQAKKSALNHNMRREVGNLLKAGKIESARVRVEHVIREDYVIEALELLRLYADMLLARYGLLTSQKELDAGISEAVHALVYAAPRVDVLELTAIREHLLRKYGKELLDRTTNYPTECVVHKLSISTPDPKLVSQYLKAIAQAYDADFRDETTELEEEQDRQQLDRDRPSNIDDLSSLVREPSKPMNLDSPRASQQPTAPQPSQGKSYGNVKDSMETITTVTDTNEPDFATLQKRFEMLRKK